MSLLKPSPNYLSHPTEAPSSSDPMSSQGRQSSAEDFSSDAPSILLPSPLICSLAKLLPQQQQYRRMVANLFPSMFIVKHFLKGVCLLPRRQGNWAATSYCKARKVMNHQEQKSSLHCL